MKKTRHFVNRHECDLDQQHYENLMPRMAPFAPAYKKWFYSLRSWIIISRWNPQTRTYFRSEYAVYREKRRQVKNRRYRFVIHPFSRFCIVREMIVCILWMIVFIIDPFFASYMTDYAREVPDNTFGIYFQLILNCMFFADMIVNFFIGYTIDKTKEIILDPVKIVKHYLYTYFVVDFFGFTYGIILFALKGTPYFYNFSVTQLYALRFVRLHTMNQYLGSMLNFFKVRESIVRCVTISLFTLYVIHWWTCALYLLPTIKYYYGQAIEGSWVIKSTVGTKRGVLNVYVECLLCTVCHFFGAGKGSIRTSNSLEQMILALMLMCGVTCHIYVIAVILQLFGTINVSESKYEELIYQLNEYMVTKRLPPMLRKRLFMYYEYRFQKQFFLEDVILSSLSEHLRYEVLLYSCRNLIDKVRIFQGASKATIGTMISMLKHEIFLPDDMIIKPDTVNEFVYFISFGTTAVFLPNGKEVIHLEDGHHFGEVHIILQNVGKKSFTTVIAIEITEVFYLEKKDFLYCVAAHPEIAERLEKVALNRLGVYRDRMDMSAEVLDTMDILTELRRGKILEQGKRR